MTEQLEQSQVYFNDDFTKFDYQNILFEFVQHLDKRMKNKPPSCGVYSDDYEFHLRCAVAEAYNKVTEYNAQKINPFAHEIEPKDAVSLSDTITCPFTKDHSQNCGCFGRGYITIKMLSEQGIRKYIQDSKKQDDYIKLQNGEKLELMMPTMWEHRRKTQ